MNQKDKIKLAIAVVVLLGAGVLIWWNMREPTPGPVKQATSSSTSAPQAPASGEPVRNGGRGAVKK